jgi:hypothetical protein
VLAFDANRIDLLRRQCEISAQDCDSQCAHAVAGYLDARIYECPDEQSKTVWVILMENHNWTGNNAGAAFGAPDIKGNPLAPYINGTLLQTSAHAEQYFNPPGNHPSQPNYLWLEAGTNFGVLADTQPGQPQLFTDQHLVKLLEDAGFTGGLTRSPTLVAPCSTIAHWISPSLMWNISPSYTSTISTMA